MKTQIKDIPGYENLYGADTDGNIYSYNYRGNGKIGKLKPTKLPQGYLGVNLCKNKAIKLYLVHRLVAITFIPNTKNKPEVNHINEIKSDNRVCNLDWVTSQENVDHSNSKSVKGVNIKTGEEIIFKSANEAGRNGYNQGAISWCCKGKRKTHKGHKWTYIAK